VIVLDTNVVSELMQVAPAASVARWLRRQAVSELSTTAITAAEVLRGIHRLPPSRKRSELQRRFEEFLDIGFRGRILPFDRAAAVVYASIVAERHRRGKPIGAFDAMIAAIASVAGADVATRDTGGFEDCGVTVVDPWR
jgi:predicted nucleic acid-binding protein